MSVALKSRLAKIARIMAKIAGGSIAFVILIILAFALLNSFDARLSEQTQVLLAAPPNPYPSEQNLYLAIAGLEGAGQQSVTEMGEERIGAYNQVFDSIFLDPKKVAAVSSKWDSTKLAFSGKVPVASLRTASIWTDVKSQRSEIAALLASNQELYRRYLSLHRLRGYFETARPSSSAPAVYVSQPLRLLFLSDVASRLQSDKLQQQREALDDIRQDLQMWRTVSKGNGNLLSKMVAVASLHADFILIADCITGPAIDIEPLNEALNSLLLPFDLQDYRIGNAFASEFRSTAALLKAITVANDDAGTPATSSSWRQKAWNAFQAHFFKINATLNLSAALAAQWSALADSKPSVFYQNRDSYREWLKLNEPHLSPASFYNPVGKILVRIAVAQVDQYPLRVYDVAAYQRLVYLAFQLTRQHIATPEVASYLLAHPEWSTHPLDGTPFSWNAQTRELAVNTLGENAQGRRFSVTLR
jgi:hypothetical protein